MRVRSYHFILSGGLGGLVGFAMLELLLNPNTGSTDWWGSVLDKGLYFGGFGLVVGAALGMTEGMVRRNAARLWYGLVVGLLLGALGGFVGGVLGQALYGMVPVRYASNSKVDIAVALDSSGSMSMGFFFGNDPWGKRKKAARQLVDRLSPTDRIAIVDFDEQAQVLYPLTAVGTPAARKAAKAAVNRVDSVGGTNLNAGLATAIDILLQNRQEGRPQHVIFLTDGVGEYAREVLSAAVGKVQIHTIGLGDEVDETVLRQIAGDTGGEYYPVQDAGDLLATFEQIFESVNDLIGKSQAAPADSQQLTSPKVLMALRIVGWAILGLVLGLGQGVRENTREDLRACALGGLLGGLIGGALFDPVSQAISLGSGAVSRALADTVVGAAIGGTMRLAQARMVEASNRPTTTLIAGLPERGMRIGAAPERPAPRPRRSTPPPPVPEPSPPPRPPSPPSPPSSPSPPPLSHFEEEYEDRSLAMAKAYAAGYRLGEIARHFGVSAPVVKRAADQHAGRSGLSVKGS